MANRKDRVVLISGASGGLGSVVTRCFLESGARVFAVARSWPESAGADPKVTRVSADLTTAAGAGQAVSRTLQEAGRVDVLLHLMGGFAGGKPVAATDDKTWLSMMDINLHGAFYMFRAVLPHMMERRKGRIIAVGSRTGVEPAAGLSAYGVSKAALTALVRTTALEVKDLGITANIVMPSVIDTSANRSTNSEADASKWIKPESIASLLLWLASDAAADVNGAVIPIYGRA